MSAAVLPYASLDTVREAIRTRHLIRFTYRKTQVVAEPHLLGSARRTHAFVLCAWRLSPEQGDGGEGWENFRYAEMRDMEILDENFSRVREGFNPYDRKLAAIDTCVRPSSR